MELKVKRIARKGEYTIGHLYVDGVYVCDTIEDRDRFHFGEGKVYGKTAIPSGGYRVAFTYSPKFGKKEPYKSLANGIVPLICDVPQFEGVRIHCGNTAADTYGCLLVGKNTVVGKVTDSIATYKMLWQKYLEPARRKKESVYILIV
ncbi:MAG: hypothetical protein IKO85_04915 [Bacteroidaceae bacterium]|nr:hypothetical protein [Bacteroidaceae bacterium]